MRCSPDNDDAVAMACTPGNVFASKCSPDDASGNRGNDAGATTTVELTTGRDSARVSSSCDEGDDGTSAETDGIAPDSTGLKGAPPGGTGLQGAASGDDTDSSTTMGEGRADEESGGADESGADDAECTPEARGPSLRAK